MVERFNAALPVVEIMARRMRRTLESSVELEDLLSYGREGLLDAARRFDASRGVPFRVYANYRVRGAMMDGVRSMSHLPRRVHERLRAWRAATAFAESAAEDLLEGAGGSANDAERLLHDHLAAMATAAAVGLIGESGRGESGEPTLTHHDDPEQAVADAELVSLVQRSIEELPEVEKQLLRRHYFEGERFDVVAEELGMSKSWASRLHTRAVARLGRRLGRPRG